MESHEVTIVTIVIVSKGYERKSDHKKTKFNLLQRFGR